MTEFTSEKMAEWRHMIKNIRSRPVESGREYLLTGVLSNALDHIERLQKRIEELESVNEDQALTISQNDYAYTIDKEMMEKRIAELECQLKSKQIVIESKEQTIREFAKKMLDLRKR